MKILVCGGRDYHDRRNLFCALDKISQENSIDLLIHGGATGADMLAGAWAKSKGLPVRIFEADWWTHGRAAGPMRNCRMLEEGRPDLVVAFPGGNGTTDMVSKAKKSGVRVIDPFA